MNITERFEGNENELGQCEKCDEEKTSCDETHLTKIQIGIKRGYWRSNELSTDVKVCFPRDACVGASSFGESNTSRTTITEQLCEIGHHGPLCSSCMDFYFKDVLNMCQSCDSSLAKLLIDLFPVLCAVGFIAALVLASALRRCGITKVLARQLPELPERLHRCIRPLLQRTFGPISARAVGIALFPKLKILIGMLQVQMGMVAVFAIQFPDDLLSKAAFTNAFAFAALN